MRKILFIDSDKEVLSNYESTLAGLGHRMIKAFDGQEGYSKYNNDRFDLIVMELELPKLPGSKLIENIRKQQGLFKDLPCPVIVCSSSCASEDIKKKFANSKMIHLMTKPIDAKSLLEKVKSLLGGMDFEGKIDVRFINPILEATMLVLSQMTQFKIDVGRPYLKAINDTSGDISGVMKVSSSGFNGSISLSFPKNGYLKVVSAMLGKTEDDINDENRDAVAELMNIIFGQAKKSLNDSGMTLKQAIPTVVCNPNHNIGDPQKSPVIVIPYECSEIGSFKSEISLVAL